MGHRPRGRAGAGFGGVKPSVLMILVGTLAVTGAIAALVFWMIGRSEDAARRSATQFVSALVQDDPALAPEGAAGYVKGVQEHFGDVRAARVVEVRSLRTGTRKRSRTYLFADVHLETETGPAVIELRLDGQSLTNSGERVIAMHEVYPRDVRDEALSDAEFVALAKAFQRRERPANDLDLSGRMMRVPDVVREAPTRVRELARSAPTPSPQLRDAQRRLRCIKRADGDVEKLMACAR